MRTVRLRLKDIYKQWCSQRDDLVPPFKFLLFYISLEMYCFHS